MRTVHVLCALALALLVSGSTARAQAPELAALLATFAKTEALSAHFREEKTMALLSVPLVSEGELHYEKPRKLARHTLSPGKSSLVLLGEQLTFGDAQHEETMGVNAHPALRVLVDTFVSVLAGDQRALSAMADVRLEKLGTKGFRIHVTPRDPAVLKLVRSMSFEGEGTNLTGMQLLDANGDLSVTTFSNVRTRARFSADEARRLFRVGQ
jgi:outer membrane lipoprotein-sorting protein